MRTVRLADITSSLESGSRPRDGVTDLPEVPSLGGEQISSNGMIREDKLRFITHETFESLKSGRVEIGDILIVKDGATTGKTAFFGGIAGFDDVALNEHVFRLKLDPAQADSRYNYWFLRSARGQAEIARDFRGATVGGISRGFVSKVHIPLPPLAEQKRIAGTLDAADALRAKRREALAQLDTLLQSTFLDMFGDPVTNPMGWEKPPLEDLCEKVIDCPHSTPRWSESGVICLRTSNLGKGEWNWADTRFVIEEDYTERTRRSEILPNDIILSREGTVGVLALVDEGMRLCMGQRLVQLRVNDSQLHPRFLLNLLLHDLTPERLSRLITGSTSKHLNVKELRKLPVLLPPLDIQRRFAVIVASVEQQKAGQRAHLDELDTLFASLQSRAFRGEL